VLKAAVLQGLCSKLPFELFFKKNKKQLCARRTFETTFQAFPLWHSGWRGTGLYQMSSVQVFGEPECPFYVHFSFLV